MKAPVSVNVGVGVGRKQTDADSGIEVDVVPKPVGVATNVVSGPKTRPMTLAEFFSRDPTLCDEFDEEREASNVSPFFIQKGLGPKSQGPKLFGVYLLVYFVFQ